MRPPGRVACVGDVVTDVLAVLAAPLAPGSDTLAAIRVTGGGQAANTAAWLAELGCPVTLAAAVGDDEAGRERLAELAAGGVTCAVRVCPGAATGAIVVLSAGDDRTMITDRGANLLLDPQTVVSAVAGADHVHLSAYTLLDARSRPAGLAALAAARDLGLTTSVDAASAEPLRAVGAEEFLSWCTGISLLLANSDEAGVLAGPGTPTEQARALLAHAGESVIKLGPAGAVWAGADNVVSEPAYPVAALDPTGAGDAFAAGLLAARMAGVTDPGRALRAGIAAGARAVAHLGARPPAVGG